MTIRMRPPAATTLTARRGSGPPTALLLPAEPVLRRALTHLAPFLHSNQADSGQNGYGDGLNCAKTIQAPAGNTIELTFTHMALESSCGSGGTNTGSTCSAQCPDPGCDTVSVYDGADTNAPRIGWLSGTDIPAAVQSTGTSLTVVFVTEYAPSTHHAPAT